MEISGREEIVAVFDALAADLNRALELDFETLTTPECLNVLERCEVLRRRLPAVEHPLINQLAERAEESELGGKLGLGASGSAAHHPWGGPPPCR
jgi:hypothetical protein